MRWWKSRLMRQRNHCILWFVCVCLQSMELRFVVCCMEGGASSSTSSWSSSVVGRCGWHIWEGRRHLPPFKPGLLILRRNGPGLSALLSSCGSTLCRNLDGLSCGCGKDSSFANLDRSHRDLLCSADRRPVRLDSTRYFIMLSSDGSVLKASVAGHRKAWLAKWVGLLSRQLKARTCMAIISTGPMALKASMKSSSTSAFPVIICKMSSTSSGVGGSFMVRFLLSRRCNCSNFGNITFSISLMKSFCRAKCSTSCLWGCLPSLTWRYWVSQVTGNYNLWGEREFFVQQILQSSAIVQKEAAQEVLIIVWSLFAVGIGLRHIYQKRQVKGKNINSVWHVVWVMDYFRGVGHCGQVQLANWMDCLVWSWE